MIVSNFIWLHCVHCRVKIKNLGGVIILCLMEVLVTICTKNDSWKKVTSPSPIIYLLCTLFNYQNCLPEMNLADLSLQNIHKTYLEIVLWMHRCTTCKIYKCGIIVCKNVYYKEHFCSFAKISQNMQSLLTAAGTKKIDSFEIAVLFTLLYDERKKRANFKNS